MTDIFTEQTAEVTFDTLVGEGKKYRDPDAIAKAKVHADQHIDKLETEMAELRAELSARLKVEEMLDKLQPQAPQAPTREITDTTRQEPGSKKDLDLTAEVQRLLKQEKEKDRRDVNITSVREGLKERFGSDYNQRLETIAAELQVSKEFLTSMASSSPSGFFKLVDSVAAPDNTRPHNPPNPSRDPLKTQHQTSRKNNAYYQEIRRSDPNLYFSRRVQNEMHAEAMKQGMQAFNS